MYYGAGLLSTIDRYPERRISRPIQPPSSRARRGRPSERGARGNQKPKRGRVRDRGYNEGSDAVSKFVLINKRLPCHPTFHRIPEALHVEWWHCMRSQRFTLPRDLSKEMEIYI